MKGVLSKPHEPLLDPPMKGYLSVLGIGTHQLANVSFIQLGRVHILSWLPCLVSTLIQEINHQ